jgi:hypothetical protein
MQTIRPLRAGRRQPGQTIRAATYRAASPSRDRQGAATTRRSAARRQPGEGQPGQTGPCERPRSGPLPSLGPAFGDAGDFLQNYRHTLRELENNPQIGKDLRDTIHDMYRLDPRLSPGNPELMNRIESQMLTGVEQIELQLRRQLDDQGGAVRSGSAEPVPQGYADAVAEYFRRLSKEK